MRSFFSLLAMPNKLGREDEAHLRGLVAGLAAVGGLVYLMATADTGPVDPTEVRQSHGTAVFNASIIVFREGLEAVLIFAAVTASFIGGNRARRRPVVLGAACAFAASFVIGSYYLAEYLRSRGRSSGGVQPAVRSTAPPEAVS